ncbi:MAG: hypothetical protein KatS3mg078_2366 [Deltaproteobacteria bacterium]|jgi:hypothetical protein|nr:MAG: hypothetical protein KatS3mg078_2366 [Deltaproteobacteria bacterium]
MNYRTKELYKLSVSVIFILLATFFIHHIYTEAKEVESPRKVILVKDYRWQSGGIGREGILEEITLQNKGNLDYKNIEIEADFYTVNDIPLGSLRATIHETLPAGSEKTFYRVNFGIMHSDLQKATIRVVDAEPTTPEKTPSGIARNSIVVREWSWTGGQYATEGILKEITLENKSENHYKDIKLQIEYLGRSIPKLGPTMVVIHDVLPARSTRTFYDVNVGFRHPNASRAIITVADAKEITTKELKYRIAEKMTEGKNKRTAGEIQPGLSQKVETPDESQRKPSLAERYREKLGQSTKTQDGKERASEEKPLTQKPGEHSEKEVALEKGPGEITEPQKQDTEEKEASKIVETPFKKTDEEAFPKADIVVKGFKLQSGITGTMGVFQEIILENKSTIPYTNIELSVDFYSRTDKRPLGSSKIKINDVLPPNSEKVFKNISIGFLNFIPEEVEVRVLNAKRL